MPPRFRALRQAPLATPPHTVHPLSIHRPHNRLRSLSFATVRASAFLASRGGKSNGGERRRPCQQGLISPWSQVRIPPPPSKFSHQDAKKSDSVLLTRTVPRAVCI